MMSNETISVPRDDLAQALSGEMKDVLAAQRKLRALLAQPAEHQGEPVAWDIYWNDNGDYYFTLRHQRRLYKYESDPDFKVVPLYTRPAEQPAPVAVVADLTARLSAQTELLKQLHGPLMEAAMEYDDKFESLAEEVAELIKIEDIARLNPPQQ